MAKMKKNGFFDFNIKKIFGDILPSTQESRNEKVLLYLRLYTDLVQAQANLSKYRFSTNYLKVVRNTARTKSFAGEEIYLKRIRSIITELLSMKQKISSEMLSERVNTKLFLAQNICILRILKL